jgi:nicotinate-nucleotide adenylyltransferase
MNIGVLGGTFDPIHEGHLTIADYVLKKMKLERIDFIPCFQPPHRDQPIASPEDRLEMVKLAIQHHPGFKVNDIEIKNPRINYTIDTLELLHQQYPKNSYYFIIGADQFLQFNTLHHWEKIITSTNVVIVSRHNEEIKIPEIIKDFIEKNNLKNHIHYCAIKPIDISATKIRTDIAAQKEKIHGLSKTVQQYILKNHLYLAH